MEDVLVDKALETWPQLVTSLTSIGFAVWYAWHVTTKTIPDLMSAHRGELAKHDEQMGVVTNKTLPELLESHRSDMARLWEIHTQEIAAIRTDFKAELTAERQHCLSELKRTDDRWVEIAKLWANPNPKVIT